LPASPGSGRHGNASDHPLEVLFDLGWKTLASADFDEGHAGPT